MNIFSIFKRATKNKLTEITLDILENNPELLEQLNNEELEKLILSNAQKLIQAKYDLKEYTTKLSKINAYSPTILDKWLNDLNHNLITQDEFDKYCFEYEVVQYEFKSLSEIVDVLTNVIEKLQYMHNLLSQHQRMNDINVKLDSYGCTLAKYDLELTKIKFNKSLSSYSNVFKSRTEQYQKDKQVLELINELPKVDNKERINFLKNNFT